MLPESLRAGARWMGDSDDHQHGANRVAHGVEHGHQHGAQGLRVEADGCRRVEVITGLERRRRWPPELKAQITAESLAPGANVSRVARLHGVSIGLQSKLPNKDREFQVNLLPRQRSY